MLGIISPRKLRMQTNAPATIVENQYGVLITAAGSVHTKGSYTNGQLLASTNFDVYMMVVHVFGIGASGNARRVLWDIGIGASGSEQTIIDNILSFNIVMANEGLQPGQMLMFPVYIPAGTRIAARSQGSVASQNMDVALVLYGGPTSPPWPVYRRGDAYGADTTNTQAVLLTAGASAGTEGSWTNVGGTTARSYHGLSIETGKDTSTAETGSVSHLEAGIGSTQIKGAEGVMAVSSQEMVMMFPGLPIPCFVPSGSQLQMRHESSLANKTIFGQLRGWA